MTTTPSPPSPPTCVVCVENPARPGDQLCAECAAILAAHPGLTIPEAQTRVIQAALQALKALHQAAWDKGETP